jgi:hypothetical protein
VNRRRAPPPRTPDARRLAEELSERRSRALEEPLDVRLRTAEVYPILEVRNPLHGTGYLVLLPEFPSRESVFCTCTDFARRGLGTCKHIEAGHRWLVAHPGTAPLVPPGRVARSRFGVWKEIDRRLAALPSDPGPDSRRYRRPGQTLFERTKARGE